MQREKRKKGKKEIEKDKSWEGQKVARENSRADESGYDVLEKHMNIWSLLPVA